MCIALWWKLKGMEFVGDYISLYWGLKLMCLIIKIDCKCLFIYKNYTWPRLGPRS